MAKKTEASAGKQCRKSRPAMTPEARENQMIALAMDAAEKQLRDGTATSQVITHFLKLGTERERLERLNLEKDILLKTAKTEAIENAEHMEELYEKAYAAFTKCRGENIEEEVI